MVKFIRGGVALGMALSVVLLPVVASSASAATNSAAHLALKAPAGSTSGIMRANTEPWCC
jgi:hypothetical protein